MKFFSNASVMRLYTHLVVKTVSKKAVVKKKLCRSQLASYTKFHFYLIIYVLQNLTFHWFSLETNRSSTGYESSMLFLHQWISSDQLTKNNLSTHRLCVAGFKVSCLYCVLRWLFIIKTRLSCANYTIWIFGVTLVLEPVDLMAYIDEIEKKPDVVKTETVSKWKR